MAAPSGIRTRPASQVPSGRASAGRSRYLSAWMASASGPPSNPPAWHPAKAGAATRHAPQIGSGPGSPQRAQPEGTGSTASAQTPQNGSAALDGSASAQAAQRGG